MQISLKKQAIERKNSDLCVITENCINDSELDFALAKILGRYPEKGQVTNTQCKEIVYVHEGEGKVVVDNKVHVLQSGDVVLIEPGEKFYWEGNMSLFISCTPAFTVEQHQLVD